MSLIQGIEIDRMLTSTAYDGHMRTKRVQGRLTDMDLLMKVGTSNWV